MQCVASSSLNLTSCFGGSDMMMTLIGRSRANDGTCFIIPELKWMFDCGALIQPGMRPKQLFLSHTHADHVSALASTVFASAASSSSSSSSSSRKKGSGPMHIYLPSKAVPFVDKYLKSHQAMCECEERETLKNDTSNNNNNNNNESSSSSCYRLIGCDDDDDDNDNNNNETVWNIDQGNKCTYMVRIVKCDHRIDCIGFSISRQQQRLREEFQQLPKQELGKLCRDHRAKHGNVQDLMMTVTEPFLCFLGDTTANVFLREQDKLFHEEQHKIIIVECTYLDDGTYENAEKYKHMHWSQLEGIVRSYPNTLFVLIHFSLRYSSLFVRNFFASYQNVHPMLIEQEIQTEWEKEQKKQQQNKSGEDDPAAVNRSCDAPPKCNCFLCLETPLE